MTKAPVDELEKSMNSTGALRLNLGGCGEGFREGRLAGFLTVDLRDGADVQSNVKDLSMFKDQSVTEIYSSNVLEHFPHTETVQVLREWKRVLIPNGKLWLSVPDFDASVRLYLKEGLVDWVKYLVWGDQLHPLNFHYVNFTFATLAKACHDAGFYDIKRVRSLPFGLDDASEIEDSHYGIRVSLNVEVTA